MRKRPVGFYPNPADPRADPKDGLWTCPDRSCRYLAEYREIEPL